MKSSTTMPALWPTYRLAALVFAAVIGIIGFFDAEGLGEGLFMAIAMGLTGFLLMLLLYLPARLVQLAFARLEPWLERHCGKRAPAGKERVRAGNFSSRKHHLTAKGDRRATDPGVLGPGVRMLTPANRPPEHVDTVTIQPGVRWLAEQMRPWRERLNQREPPFRRKPWSSYEEAAAALEHAVRPAVQGLARELTALSTAAYEVKAGEAMPETAAARFAATLEHWLTVRAALAQRTFAQDPLGDGRFDAILAALDARLDQTFAAYIRLVEYPWEALRWADANGQVSITVDFDCQREVKDFADWAALNTRARRHGTFWWLVAAFATGYWLGE